MGKFFLTQKQNFIFWLFWIDILLLTNFYLNVKEHYFNSWNESRQEVGDLTEAHTDKDVNWFTGNIFVTEVREPAFGETRQ